jgi:hypothetical protein
MEIFRPFCEVSSYLDLSQRIIQKFHELEFPNMIQTGQWYMLAAIRTSCQLHEFSFEKNTQKG